MESTTPPARRRAPRGCTPLGRRTDLHLLPARDNGPSLPCTSGTLPVAAWDEDHPLAASAVIACQGCTVRAACAERALTREPYLIWGGTTPKDRAAERRHRHINIAELDLAAHGIGEDEPVLAVLMSTPVHVTFAQLALFAA